MLTTALVVAARAEIYSLANRPARVTPPQPRETPAPAFPSDVGKEDEVGLAMVEQTIDPSGAVIRSDVVAQAHPKFGEAAYRAARNWKYEPAKMDGRPVAFRELAPVVFTKEKNETLEEHLAGAEAVLLGFPLKPPSELGEKYHYDLLPEPVEVAAPIYPWQQFVSGKSGSATVGYGLDEAGHVVEARIVNATEPAFGQALLAAVESWRFKPAKKKDGTPTLAVARLKFDFNLYLPPDAPEIALRGELAAAEKSASAKKEEQTEFTAKDLDAPLRPSHREPPAYPLACVRDAPGGGRAVIECLIDRDGWVRLPHVISATREEFGWAAATSAARWKFEPPKRHGEPAVVRVRLPFAFKPVEPPPPAKPSE